MTACIVEPVDLASDSSGEEINDRLAFPQTRKSECKPEKNSGCVFARGLGEGCVDPVAQQAYRLDVGTVVIADKVVGVVCF